MKHTYHIHGMSCNGCRSHVEQTLSYVPGVLSVQVDLEKTEAIIEMSEHIDLEVFQKALQDDGGRYSIHNPGEHHHHVEDSEKKVKNSSDKEEGLFYCPMRCEGDKTYDAPGDCPVCGMDLVPLKADVSAEEKNYRVLLKKFWIALFLRFRFFG